MYNEALHVSVVQGRLQLTTDDAIYSWADKYNNFKTVLMHLDWSKLDYRETLVLGLGLGSIPFMMEKMGYASIFTGVEIDEEVIYLASKYTLSSLSSPIDVIHADAASYLTTTTRRFDLIAMDVFVGQTVPEVFLSIRFATQLAQCITMGGTVIYNMLAHNEQDLQLAKSYYQNVFLLVFPESTYMRVKGNLMLISNKHVLLSAKA